MGKAILSQPGCVSRLLSLLLDQRYCSLTHVGDHLLMSRLTSVIILKRRGPFVAFYFYCKIMLYGINYTYYSVKTVKICFHVPFRG